MKPRTRVAKVGGSLLTWSALPNALLRWLQQEPAATTVMIAGGGPWAELLRQAAKRFSFEKQAAHEMCVQAMSVTASLLAELCDCPCAMSLDEIHKLSQSSDLIVFDAQQWLGSEHTLDLPKTWDVTSDSIAARLATQLQADELVLFKSQTAPSDDAAQLAEAEYVDRYFPIAAKCIPSTRYVNLRTK